MASDCFIRLLRIKFSIFSTSSSGLVATARLREGSDVRCDVRDADIDVDGNGVGVAGVGEISSKILLLSCDVSLSCCNCSNGIVGIGWEGDGMDEALVSCDAVLILDVDSLCFIKLSKKSKCGPQHQLVYVLALPVLPLTCFLYLVYPSFKPFHLVRNTSPKT